MTIKTETRKAKIPREVLLKVQKGCTAYAGVATCLALAGEDVIIMARSIDQLDVIFNRYRPGQALQTASCYDVVLTAAMYATLDEI